MAKKKKAVLNEYEVTVPFAGTVGILVKAETEAAAIEAALATDCRFSVKGKEAELYEVEMLRAITQGNVCHAPQNRIDCTQVG